MAGKRNTGNRFFAHADGKRGGHLVGRSHAQGGIKAVNKDSGQPLEVEGREVIINKKSVEDPTPHNFNGRKMTNRQILSAINSQNGNGVAFADGGDIPDKINVTRRRHRYNGKVRSEASIAHSCGCKHSMARGGRTDKKDDADPSMTQTEFLQLTKQLRPFVPASQIKSLIDIFHGEEKAYAIEVATRLFNIWETMPKTYGTEETETDDKIVYLHYFHAGSDWYIVEKDMEPEQQQAFGFVILNEDYQNSEWGYVSLVEILEQRKIELDFNFEPIKFGELKKEWEEPMQEEKAITVRKGKDLFTYGDGYGVPPKNSEELKTALKNKTFKISFEHHGYIVVSQFLNDKAELMIVDNGGEFNLEDYKDRTFITHIPYDTVDGLVSPENLAMRIAKIYEDYFFRHEEQQVSNTTFTPAPVSTGPATGEKPDWLEIVKVNRGILYTDNRTDKVIASITFFPLTFHLEDIGPEYGDAIFIAQQEYERLLLEKNAQTGDKATGQPIKAIENGGFKSAKQRAVVNNQVRNLVRKYGTDRTRYSAEDLALLKQYQGAGGQAKEGDKGARLFDQFFTNLDICAKMWGLAFKYGFNFKGTSICEPAVGSGNFLQFIPVNANVSVTAFEVDDIAYTISKVLFPLYDIRHASFETLFFQGRRHIGLAGVKEFYDLVIGNPPYRDYISEYSPLGERDATGAFTFEMYFIMRGVDILKKDGLLIYIIPNLFLSNDNKYNDFKARLAEKCDLIDAYRLPNGVFDNTEVGTDIIVLRKK
jgi:hypothetical protein